MSVPPTVGTKSILLKNAKILAVVSNINILVVSVGLSVCLFVSLSVRLFVCAEFFSAVFDPISIKLEQMLCVWV